MRDEGVADGGRVGGVADDDGGAGESGGGNQGGELGGGADEDGDGVVVGEEGGEEARAQVAGCAEEEDFHGFCFMGLAWRCGGGWGGGECGARWRIVERWWWACSCACLFMSLAAS